MIGPARPAPKSCSRGHLGDFRLTPVTDKPGRHGHRAGWRWRCASCAAIHARQYRAGHPHAPLGLVAKRRRGRLEELRTMRDFLGLSWDECAQQLGITTNALDMWVRRTGLTP